jgi:hypothetical protein
LSKVSVAPKRSTRQERGILLFRAHGEQIEHVEGWRWRVPSCSDSSTYLVDLRAESCECPDTPPEGEVCKHITAAIIARAKSQECSGCGKKVRRRTLLLVPEDHPTLGGLVDKLCQVCAVSEGVA